MKFCVARHRAYWLAGGVKLTVRHFFRGYNFTEEVADRFFEYLDKEKRGMLDYAKFVNFIRPFLEGAINGTPLTARDLTSCRGAPDSVLEDMLEAFATEFTKALNRLEVPFEMTGSHKKRAPCGPKPTALRPVRARKLRGPNAEEERAKTFVQDLIDGALAEEVDVAGEDVTYCDESDEDTEDEVVSLSAPSDDEEDEEDESLGLASVVAQRVFHEAFLPDMQMQDSAEDVDDDFEDEFVEVEEVGDEFVMQQGMEHLCAKLGGELLSTTVEAACRGTLHETLAEGRKKPEIDIQAIEALGQQARPTLVRAAEDGSLGKALQEAQVETLRVETRDCLLAAARDGRLAAALQRKMAITEDSPQGVSEQATANTPVDVPRKPEPLEQDVKEKPTSTHAMPDVPFYLCPSVGTWLNPLAFPVQVPTKPEPVEQDVKEKAASTHAMPDLPFYLCPSVGTWLNPLAFPVQVPTKPEPVEQLSMGAMPDLRAACRAKRRIIGAVVRVPAESVPEDSTTSATSFKFNRPWVMAGSPAAGLRFKGPTRKEPDASREGPGKSSIAAMFEAMGSTELYRTDEKFPDGKLTMPGMLKSASAGSVSAFALDLGTTVSSQKLLAAPLTAARCSSVGALRSLKAEKAVKHGGTLPFLQKSGNRLPHVTSKKMQAWCSATPTMDGVFPGAGYTCHAQKDGAALVALKVRVTDERQDRLHEFDGKFQESLRILTSKALDRFGSLANAFRFVDLDRNCNMTRNETEYLFRLCNLPAELAVKFHDAVDTNGSGEISLQEFHAALAPYLSDEDQKRQQLKKKKRSSLSVRFTYFQCPGSMAGVVNSCRRALHGDPVPPLPAQQVILLGGASSPGSRMRTVPQESPGILGGRPAVRAPQQTRGVQIAAPLVFPGRCSTSSSIEMLAISAVQLPPQWMEKRDSVTFFAVDVISESGASWRVMRRYTDFLELKDQLGHVSSSFPAARFPKKHCFSCEGQKLEVRREALELWLRRATEHPRSSAEWLGPLRRFLESGRKFITTESSASAPAANNDQMEDDTLLEVLVPPGVRGGQLLTVSMPDGNMKTITLPKDAVCGSQLNFRYSYSRRTLSPADYLLKPYTPERADEDLRSASKRAASKEWNKHVDFELRNELRRLMQDVGDKLLLKFKHVRDAFKPLNLQRLGKITREEMHNFFRGFGHPEEVADRIFDLLDQEGKGEIEYSVFMSHFESVLGRDFRNFSEQPPIYLEDPIKCKEVNETADSLKRRLLTRSRNMKEAFRALDSDHDGQVSRSELRMFGKKVGVTMQSCDQLFDALDVEGVGSINFLQFTRIFPEGKNAGTPRAVYAKPVPQPPELL
ncbi:CML6 [Symbiodinium sp. KB8]|nr:CML6 [Symbiodinium sp. KB8]